VRYEETRARFGKAVACLYGGRARPEGGLGLPRAELARHALLAMHAGPNWPAQCIPRFEALVQPQAAVLLPWVKNAEAGVRAAVGLARRALERANRERAGGAVLRLSSRPHRAVQRQRSALAVHAEAVGSPASGGDAVRFAPIDSALPETSCVPIAAVVGGTLHLVLRGDGLVAFALDARGLGVTRVRWGGVDARRIARPRGAHSRGRRRGFAGFRVGVARGSVPHGGRTLC
jgi:hypothetical protein